MGKTFRSLATCVAAASGLFYSQTLWAQAAWERLETRIRQQVQQPPQDAQPEVVPAPQNGPALGPNVLPQMLAQPGKASPSGGAKPYLGILADDSKDRGRGVRVLKVFPSGPGEKAGVQEQDLITAVADVRVRQMTELADILELYAAGDQVTVDLLRGDQPQKLRLTLAARPTDNAAASATPPSSPTPVSGAVVPPPPAPGPTPETVPATDDRARIIALERRVAELERRVQQLERRLTPP